MIKHLIIGFGLMLISSAAFSFSLYDYQGMCGSARAALGDTTDRDGFTRSGLALFDRGRWWIIIDPNFIRAHSPLAIDFLYLHECGHVVNNHTSAYTAHGQEDTADCYARARFERMHGRNNLYRTLNELSELNGEARNKRILQCK